MKKTLLAALIMGLTGAVQAKQKVVAGYFADWQYANAENPYTVNDIPADKLTHVIYAFLSSAALMPVLLKRYKNWLQNNVKEKIPIRRSLSIPKQH
ncbi:hypothetical protein VEx25_A1041 [Vibrio antiquarius]|uniref:GH18 domain-containing protein n=1 Tax=Vibrio antiquarius (strain Ex25) TaxID=150340 RepID=A0ABM9WZ23_VIBAE|nr:hypothetical protein VEx25_A1041 [Vibrio antiquarius]